MSNMITIHNEESRASPRFFDLSIKAKTGSLEHLGGVIVRKNRVKVYWGESKSHEEKENDEGETENSHETREGNDEGMPFVFRKLLSRKDEPRIGCATTVKEDKMLHEKDNEAAQILVSGMNDSEWWTMVFLTDHFMRFCVNRNQNRNLI